MNIASLFQGVATLAWLGFFALLVLLFIRSTRQQSASKGLGTFVLIVLAVAVVLTSIGAGLVFVEPEERGVVVTIARGGVRPDPLQPGLHWILPFVERVEHYSIARQTYTMSVAPDEGQKGGDDSIRARTKDGQEVLIDASVVYQIDPSKLIQLRIDWQKRFQDELVRPAARNIIRDAASQYNVEEIVSSKRVELEETMTRKLGEKFAENDLILVDFLLRDIHFSEEYAAAVEQKQIAEQQAQQAKFVVESKKQEAEQARQVAQGAADAAVIAAKGAAESRLIQAQAEAQANQLIAQSIQGNQALLQYLYIQKLAPTIQTMLLPSGSPLIIPLPGQ